MKLSQFSLTVVGGISSIFLGSIPAHAFNLIDNSSPIYTASYPIPFSKDIGRVWVDPIQKLPPPNRKLLGAFKQQFPEWEFESSFTPIYGDLVVNNYKACVPGDCGLLDPAVGGYLNLKYVPKKIKFFDPELGRDVEYNDFPDPATGRVHWLQWVEDNHKEGEMGGHGIPEKIVDTDSNTPFYYGDKLIGNSNDPLYFLRNKQDPYFFDDIPSRLDIKEDHDWTANLYLAYQKNDANGYPLKVQIFGGVSWGWHNRVDTCSSSRGSNLSSSANNCPLDLTLVFDTTGSMYDDLDQVQNSALELVDELFTEIPNARVSVVDYRDFPSDPYGETGDYPYHALLPFSDDFTDITDAINRLSIGSGGNWPKSAYSALINTLQG